MKPGAPLVLVALLALTFAAYLPALDAGFVWDDDDYVVDNPLLRDGRGLLRIWTTTETPQYYPLVFTTFWIEQRLWGLHPAGYHAVNVLLHALDAFLVGLVLRRLGLRGAWWVAALFAVHPVHVESVAWITERKNVLSALFYLLAFLAYLRFAERRRWRDWGLAFLAFLAAMASKTVAASLGLALALALVWRHGRPRRSDWLPLVPFLLVGATWPLVTVRLEAEMVGAVAADFALSGWQRSVVACRALLFYPTKILVPWPLIFNYPRWSLDAPLAALLAPVAAVAALAAGLAVAWLRGRRGIVLAALFYVVTIFPALGFLDVYPFRYSFVADHFQYLASLGPLILLVQAVLALDDRMARAARPGHRAAALGIVSILVLGTLTWRQAGAYHDLRTLWQHTIARNPASWLAHNNLGLLLLDEGDPAAALEHLDRAVEAKPGSAESLTARGLAHARLGRDREAGRDFDRAVELDPTYPQARLNRGNFRLDRGALDAAIEDLTVFLRSNPDYLPAFRSRARARLAAGRLDEALPDFDEIVRRSPDYEAFLNRGVARVNAGRLDEAVDDFTRALDLRPDSVDALGNRAVARIRLERFDAALPDLDRALALDPTRSRLVLLRGGVHRTLGDLRAACADWETACRLGDCRLLEQHCVAARP